MKITASAASERFELRGRIARTLQMVLNFEFSR